MTVPPDEYELSSIISLFRFLEEEERSYPIATEGLACVVWLRDYSVAGRFVRAVVRL